MRKRTSTVFLVAALLVLVLAGTFMAIWPHGAAQAPSEPRTWNEDEAPNYYLVIGAAEFDEYPAEGTVEYSPLDRLGRAGDVVACVNAELAESGASRERESMADLRPSGWGYNEEAAIELPTGDVYHGYFWNRSHLLAKSLGGEEILQNLVCGTRMQNVGANLNGTEGGMAYTETLARDWLRGHPQGCVYYAATPEYVGGEPVCRDVVVDILTSDHSINQRVVVFNAAKGYDIDYATGRFVLRR